ncbi:hypothetical protein N431DRAFT_465989 [Stipitochalara longipes BDJ]|nr:hypothetical protein N431DRAFT_465989 [Stipitochalara longipes BDJ]
MDLIYQKSEVTTVALGADPTYGLPGVGERPRLGQECLQLGNYLLISSLVDPRYYIDASTWTDRGWTYQEALLSRRRLVFTDEQVYYECYSMHCCEALDFHLRIMHTQSLQMFKKPFCAGENYRAVPERGGHPSDILNGILGILRAYEKSIHRVRHFFGIPLLPPPVGMTCQISRKESSPWNSQMGFALGLCWDLEDQNHSPSYRRPGFPSWSWTGWSGIINWKYTDKNTVWVDAGFQVRFELLDGQMMEWPTFHASYDALDDYRAVSQYIIISAWTTRIKLLGYGQPNTHDVNDIFCLSRFELEDGGYITWLFSAATKEELSSDKEYLGIHLIDYEPATDRTAPIFRGPALLVVSKVEERMERVGFGWVTHFKCSKYSVDGVWEYGG